MKHTALFTIGILALSLMAMPALAQGQGNSSGKKIYKQEQQQVQKKSQELKKKKVQEQVEEKKRYQEEKRSRTYHGVRNRDRDHDCWMVDGECIREFKHNRFNQYND